MLNLNVFAEYTLSVFVAGLCLLPIILHKKSVAKNKVYLAIVFFVSNVLMISILLCTVFLRELLSSIYPVNAVLRFLDYFFYGTLLYTWENLLEKLALEASAYVNKLYFHAGKIISVAGTIIFVVIAVFYMNNSYYISNPFMETVYTFTEDAFAITATMAVIVSSFYACSIIPVRTTRRYIYLVSTLVSIYFIFQILITSGLGAVEHPRWNEPYPDFAGWILFGIGCFTLGFLFKKDFQLAFVPAYDLEEMEQNKPALENPEVETTLRLDKIATDHLLTVREREILELLYSGHTNADISSKLSISPNTAKSHIKNIYDKLGVSSRMELSYLVGSFDLTDIVETGKQRNSTSI